MAHKQTLNTTELQLLLTFIQDNDISFVKYVLPVFKIILKDLKKYHLCSYQYKKVLYQLASYLQQIDRFTKNYYKALGKFIS